MFNLDEFCEDCRKVLEDRQLKQFRALVTPTTASIVYSSLSFLEPMAGSRYEQAKQLLLGALTQSCLKLGASAYGESFVIDYVANQHFDYHLVAKAAVPEGGEP